MQVGQAVDGPTGVWPAPSKLLAEKPVPRIGPQTSVETLTCCTVPNPRRAPAQLGLSVGLRRISLLADASRKRATRSAAFAASIVAGLLDRSWQMAKS